MDYTEIIAFSYRLDISEKECDSIADLIALIMQ